MPSAARGRRAHLFFIVAMLVIVPLYSIWTCSDQLGHLGGDSAYYLMMAHTFAPFLPHDDIYAAVTASSRFPPLYPLWLALTGAADNLVLAHLVTTATLFAALIVLYLWLLRIGASNVQAAGVAVLTACLPQTLFLALWPQSEYPYLLLSLVSLVALDGYRRAPTLRRALIALLLVAATVLTRTIGVALIAAMGIVFLTGSRRRDLLLIPLAVLPAAVWVYLHPSPTGYVNTLSSSYGDHTLQRIWLQLAEQPELLRFGFAGNFLQTVGLISIVDAVGILTGLAWLYRLVKLEADAVYCAAYLGVLAIWPFPEEIARLLWPIVPVLISGLVVEAVRLGARISALVSELAGAGLIAALFLLVAPFLALIVDRWTLASGHQAALRHLPEWYDLDPHLSVDVARTHAALEQFLRALPGTVPPDDCVAHVRPELVEYLAHRRAVIPPPSYVSDADFLPRLRASGCHYLLMVAWKDRLFQTTMYPLTRIRDQIDIVDTKIVAYEDRPYQYAVALVGRLKPPEVPAP